MLAACAASWTACGSSTSDAGATPAGDQTTRPSSASGGESPPPSGTGAPETCPSTYAEASDLRIDCLGGALPPPLARGCQYAEGACYCGEERQCSGAERPPTPPVWQCVSANLPPCPDYP